MIGAVVLAAGQSRRMGRPKLCLPWGTTTILGQVMTTLGSAGLDEIMVVTGAARQEVETLLLGLAGQFPLHSVHNPDYAQTGMLGSVQTGLRALSAQVEAALIVLGDQPQVQKRTVELVLEAYKNHRAGLVIPSYNKRRGHPWLVARRLWPSLLSLASEQTLRDFLSAHSDEILYVPIEDDSILRDIDTPEQYASEKPTQENE
ncbi:MAG: nucleotidyltransferase family protein [Candidatus Villigracilaceae bacterium]